MSIRTSLRQHVLAWVVLVAAVGILVTGAGMLTARQSQQRAAEAGVQRRADLTAEIVEGEVLRYEDTLRTTAAAVSAQQDLERADFDQITQPLSGTRLRGAAGISFLVPATTRQTRRVQALWRRHGATGLVLQPVPDRASHVYTIYSRSLDGRSAVTGRDLTAVPELAASLQAGNGTNQVAVSDPYVLLKDRGLPAAQRQFSLALMVRVSDPQGDPRGWVIMGVRGRDLMTQTLQQTGQDALNASLTTRSASGRTLTLVRHVSGPAHDPRLIRRVPIAIGQQTWTLTMQGTDAAADRDTGHDELGRAILVGGALITALLAGLVYLLSTSRARALRAAEVANAELLRANQRFRFAFEESPTGMAVLDVRPAQLGRFLQVNQALCDVLGRSVDDLAKRSVLDLTHPDEVSRDRELLQSMSADGRRTVRMEKRYVHASGRIVYALINGTLVTAADGTPECVVAQIEDVTAQRAERQRLSAMALRDTLTGLGNRLLFQDHMSQAVARTARSGRPLGVIYCDLDLFKEINDNYGHAAGDTVLQEVADRLRLSVRPADTIARIGGDEFVVLCEDLTESDAIEQVVARIRKALSQPVTIQDDVQVTVACSIGTATGSGGDLDISTLLHQADLAMYREKNPPVISRT